MTQEFRLSITPVGPDTYWLRTEDPLPDGVPVAEAQVTWPLTDWLAQAEVLLQDPLQALMADGAPRSDNLWLQLGQALYDGLFQGRIRDSWLAAQAVAQNRRQPLGLRLMIFRDRRVLRLPWELLYGDDRPLATGLDVTLCRYYHGEAVTKPSEIPKRAPVSIPLRVLVVISAPHDQERLALRQEVQTLIAALQPAPTGTGYLALEVTILEQPGRPELVQALEQGHFQMLHYAGHSDVSETGGDLFLVNRHTGLSDSLSGEDLAGLLVNNEIHLAVFNSCRGGYIQDDAHMGGREQNLVQALVNRGVPAVIAMAERIPDDVALTFTQLLYHNLHQGSPIDLCLSRVRQGLMSAYGSGQPFWMLPLLYLRPDFDGYLYVREDPAGGLGNVSSGDLTAVLMPPDYSTDPDISSLAAEIFTRHEALAPLGADPVLPLYDWLQESEQGDESAVADTVDNLVQQLSRSPADAEEQILSADPAETLRPSSTLAGSTHSAPLPGTAAPSQRFDYPIPPGKTPRWAIPFNRLAWGGLGLAGLGAVLGLTVTTLSRVDRPTPAESLVRPDLSGNPPRSGTNTALLSSAITAITLDRLSAARPLVEQLLEAKDLTAAESAMAVVTEPQQLDPDIAYLRGRLAWQQWIVDSTAETSPNDVMRAWQQAVEGNPDLLEAWVGLGFAHYALQDYSQAIQAWERAITIDQSQRRDIKPEADLEVINPMTVHAYAGLAMAYQHESTITVLPEEQALLQQTAQRYYTQTLALDPTLINPNTLALTWLWPPALIRDWQGAVAQLAVSGGDAGLDSDNGHN